MGLRQEQPLPGEGLRQEQPLPEDYNAPVAEMETNHILKSTLTVESRQEKGDQKLAWDSPCARETCVRDHLGLGNVSKKVQQCKPSVEHIELHAQVVKEVKRRDEYDKIQAREMVQRSLESGQADDVIDVDKFGKRSRSSNNWISCPFQTVRKREEVDMQWSKSVVSAGLPMSLFDNPEVRKTVLMTSECGQNYIRTKPPVTSIFKCAEENKTYKKKL